MEENFIFEEGFTLKLLERYGKEYPKKVMAFVLVRVFNFSYLEAGKIVTNSKHICKKNKYYISATTTSKYVREIEDIFLFEIEKYDEAQKSNID